jgi:hypothetical protein
VLRGRHAKWSKNSEYLTMSCSLLKHHLDDWTTFGSSFFSSITKCENMAQQFDDKKVPAAIEANAFWAFYAVNA